MKQKHLFDASLYDFNKPQPSYWEATAVDPNAGRQPVSTNETCDVAIIGAGYTGLSAALHLARDYGVDTRILEAGHIGWGASGRNGGFVSIGGTYLKKSYMCKRFGVEEARRYYQCQADAVNLVRELAEQENIDFAIQGDREYEVADSAAHFDGLVKDAKVERELFGLNTQMLSQDEFREHGYSSPHQHGALRRQPAFALHPLKYVFGLAQAAEKHGAKLYPHSEVIAWNKQNGKHVLQTRGGSLTANKIIVAGNGFMPEHIHKQLRGRPLPLQSMIVVTRPLTDEELKQQGWKTQNPMVNSAHLYNYYRLLTDNRLMVGGRGDHTGNPQAAAKTAEAIHQRITERWPAFKHADIDYKWRGLVCFTSRLRPSIGKLPDDDSVYCAFGYHGNGVNTSTWCGRELAKWMAGTESCNKNASHLPTLVRGLTPRIPLSFLRKQYAQAGIALWKLRDRLG